MRCITSEYHVVEVVFKDEGCLLQSLKDLGYNPVVHKNGVKLNNNYSKSRPTAHIVVDRGQFGGMGDLGFERGKKGFTMHADDYDYGSHGHRFKLNKLNKKYVENRVKRYASGTADCTVLSSRENDKGQVEIQLRISN